MTAKDLRAKRATASIPGHAVCRVAGIARPKLSDIEREVRVATPEELQRIDAAIDQIINARLYLAKVAADAGLSLAGVRL